MAQPGDACKHASIDACAPVPAPPVLDLHGLPSLLNVPCGSSVKYGLGACQIVGKLYLHWEHVSHCRFCRHLKQMLLFIWLVPPGSLFGSYTSGISPITTLFTARHTVERLPACRKLPAFWPGQICVLHHMKVHADMSRTHHDVHSLQRGTMPYVSDKYVSLHDCSQLMH